MSRIYLKMLRTNEVINSKSNAQYNQNGNYPLNYLHKHHSFVTCTIAHKREKINIFLKNVYYLVNFPPSCSLIWLYRLTLASLFFKFISKKYSLSIYSLYISLSKKRLYLISNWAFK